VAWINVCKPKDQGGLGIKDMGIQNICLLLKLIHKLHCPTTSAWAQWVKERASVVTLTGDIHGDHWNTLHSILPLYRAITTVNIGDGKSPSFWYAVWAGEDAFDEIYPTLHSHCTFKQASVSEMVSTGVQNTLVSRLSAQAANDLLSIHEKISNLILSQDPKSRTSLFSREEQNLDSR